MPHPDTPRNEPAALRLIDRLSGALAVVAAVGLVLLAANIFVDVIGRAFLNRPFTGTLEMTAYWWMPVLTLFAFAFTEKRQEHIKVTLLLDTLPPRMRHVVEGCFGLITVALLAWLAWYTIFEATESAGYRETTASTPPVVIWPFKFVAVIGIAMLALQSAATAWRHFAGLMPDHPAADTDSEAMQPMRGSDLSLSGARAPARRVPVLVFVICLGVALAAIGAMVLGDLPKQVTGLLVVVLSIVLLLMGIPVGIAMLGAALLGLYTLSGMRVVRSTMESVAYDATASWSYSVIPMFILMGMILWKSGLTSTAFEAARRWLGWLPGGLAVATNFAGAVLAASSGSTIGITYALGKVSIPEMLKSGYHPQLAVGSVAAAGTLGQIIPPSLLLVVYAGAASLPVGQQLLAGVIPGLLLALAFAAMIVGHAMLRPQLAPRVDMSGITWAMRLRALVGVIPIAFVVLVVIGGLFAGIFTATEAGVFGMLSALVFGTFHMIAAGRGWRAVGVMVKDSVIGTLTGTASVFLLIVGVAVLTRAMALSQVPNFLASEIAELGLGRVELLLILILVYLLLGMFMDTLAMMLLTIPVLMAPLVSVGVDPLWFGVFLVVMAEVGLLTPPLGILTFIVHRIAMDPQANLGREIPLSTVFLGVLPFALTAIAVVLLLIAFPGLVTWLPGASVTR